jgi:tRNA modification GTPase
MQSGSTIAALATAHGTAALALIRISGDRAISIVKGCVDLGESFDNAPLREVRLYRIVNEDGGEPLDQVTAIKYRAPRTYTGEDMVEIICHGGGATVERILERLLSGGAVYASKGEFTRRAFLNGKVDLAGAEAVNQVVRSRRDARYRNALESYFGGYRAALERWRAAITAILVDIESAIEFGDEDVAWERASHGSVGERISSLRREVVEEVERRREIELTGEGAQVAFVGPPNVGKSTILNLVLGYERAIVFPEEGTTRDAVSEIVSWRGMDVKFVDSAGLRAAATGVEQMGVDRSWAFVETSELVVLVTAANEALGKVEEEIVSRRGGKGGLVGIVNKSDLAAGKEKMNFFAENAVECIQMSAIDVSQRQKVVDFLFRALEKMRGDIEQRSIVCTRRQERIARQMADFLEEMEDAGRGGGEVVAYYGRKVLELLDEFVGKTTSEDILNAVFDEFCVGK